MQAPRTDIQGLIGDLIRRGTIASIDLDAGQATVTIGDIETQALPWLDFAGGLSSWLPPSVGEQVLILCPEADIAAAFILRGLRSNANPAPATGLKFHVRFPDGASVEYDPSAHVLAIDAAAGKMTIAAAAGVEITGPFKVTGDSDLTGKLNVSNDVSLAAKLSVTGDLDVTGNSTLGSGASKFVKLADDSPATKVKAK